MPGQNPGVFEKLEGEFCLFIKFKILFVEFSPHEAGSEAPGTLALQFTSY